MNALADTLIAVDNIAGKFEGYFFLKDLRGKYFLVNEPLAKFIGIPKEQIIGKMDEDIFPPDAVALIRQRDQMALQSNSYVQYSDSMMLDGKQKNYVTLKCVVKYTSGKPFCFCTFAASIEKKELLYAIKDQIHQIFQNTDLNAEQF